MKQTFLNAMVLTALAGFAATAQAADHRQNPFTLAYGRCE